LIFSLSASRGERGLWRVGAALAAAGVHDGQADAVAVGEDSGVSEAEDAEAGAFEVDGAAGVIGDLVGVLAAVDLQDQGGVAAEKIEDVGAEGDLALPLPAAESARAQGVPETSLRVGVTPAKVAGALEGHVLAEGIDPAHLALFS